MAPLITWRFVDAPTASPTVLFDMNNGTTTRILDPGPEMPAPPLKRSIAANAMVDGGLLTAAAYDLRELKFTVWLNGANQAAQIAQLDALKRELAKPSNLLMFTPPGGSNPVFFRTLRSDDYLPDYQGAAAVNWKIQCTVLAEPYAIGVRRDLATVTITNDPAASGAALNSNTSFETNLNGWTGFGGTFVRDTTQFHSGVASAKISPDGVSGPVSITSAQVPVTGAATYRAQAWVRCALSRNILININWYTSGSTLISTGTGTLTVSANTWTLISADMTAPSNAAFASIFVSMAGVPPTTSILNVDEVELRAFPVGNTTFVDLIGIVGDSPTPAFMRIGNLGAGGVAIVGQRTANNPTALTVFAQAENATLGTDVQTWTSNTMSGNNGVYVTFSSNSNMVTRLTFTLPTATSSEALRGRYRVFLRVHTGGTSSTYVVRYVQNPGGGMDVVNGPPVPYTANTVWQFLDLGTIDFPAFQTPPSIGYSGLAPGLATAQLAIQASRTNSGLDNLDIDYVYLMPADERLCSVSQTASTGYVVLDGPNNATYGMAAGSSPFSGTVAGRVIDNAGGLVPRFGGLPMLVPAVTNRLYMLVDKQDVATTKTVDVSYWPRWREVATS